MGMMNMTSRRVAAIVSSARGPASVRGAAPASSRFAADGRGPGGADAAVRRARPDLGIRGSVAQSIVPPNTSTTKYSESINTIALQNGQVVEVGTLTTTTTGRDDDHEPDRLRGSPPAACSTRPSARAVRTTIPVTIRRRDLHDRDCDPRTSRSSPTATIDVLGTAIPTAPARASASSWSPSSPPTARSIRRSALGARSSSASARRLAGQPTPTPRRWPSAPTARSSPWATSTLAARRTTSSGSPG